KMLMVRLIHAVFSLLTVILGFKITEKLADRKTTAKTALLLAAVWFLPFFSVRNLVEIFCIPFLMAGLYLVIKQKKLPGLKNYILAGFIIGIGFSVRFQTIVFAAGLFLAVLLYNRKAFLMLCLGYLASILLIQGGIDMFIWGRPFAEFREYVSYNFVNASNYIVNSWYIYLLLITGILIPPISLFLFFGFFRSWKKYPEMFLPALLFLLFHSIFPNKQERFIFPVIPFIIILGMIGWNDFTRQSEFWQKNKKLENSAWVFFWIINIILLVPVGTMYSKKARVEAMTYLSRYQNIESVLVDDANSDHATMLPKFYLRQWVQVSEISKNHTIHAYLQDLSQSDSIKQPRFVLFINNLHLDERVKSIQQVIPGLEYETKVDPGFVDYILNKLNPVNSNQAIFIYRNTRYYPAKVPG
ncbi:MAG: glycosyltransferase family 39 protein, partial [Bacteroidetes bacterium]|nr:glycosyltransferase family 39 protein [Bacteroidota bacterium]